MSLSLPPPFKISELQGPESWSSEYVKTEICVGFLFITCSKKPCVLYRSHFFLQYHLAMEVYAIQFNSSLCRLPDQPVGVASAVKSTRTPLPSPFAWPSRRARGTGIGTSHAHPLNVILKVNFKHQLDSRLNLKGQSMFKCFVLGVITLLPPTSIIFKTMIKNDVLFS